MRRVVRFWKWGTKLRKVAMKQIYAIKALNVDVHIWEYSNKICNILFMTPFSLKCIQSINMDRELKSDDQMNRWIINSIFDYNFAIKNYFINFYTIALLLPLICSYNANN